MFQVFKFTLAGRAKIKYFPQKLKILLGSLKETLCQDDNLFVGMLFVKKVVMMLSFFKW